MFDKYEELNLAQYVEGKEESMIFANTQGGTGSLVAVKESMEKLTHKEQGLKNPYVNLYQWCKGEVFDIDAISQALKKRDEINSRIGNNQKRKKNQQTELNNKTQGKQTMKSMFVKTDANTMVN